MSSINPNFDPTYATMMNTGGAETTPRKEYIHDHEAALNNHETRSAAESAAFLLPHLHTDTKILDIGTGAGTITADLGEHILRLGGDSSQVVGVDYSADAVATATKIAAQRGLGIRIEQADTYKLPFEDAFFDVVYAHQILHHLTDPLAALKEWKRVVKPGGVIASREADYGAMTWYPPTPGLARWRAIFSVVLANSGGEPNTGRHTPTWFHQAGLSSLTVSSSTWTYGDDESRRWLAESWSARTCEESYQLKAAEALNDLVDCTDQRGDGSDEKRPGDITAQAIEQIVGGWSDWARTPGAIFMIPSVEVIAQVR